MKIEIIEVEMSNLMTIMHDESLYGIKHNALFNKYHMWKAKELSLEDIMSGGITFIRISK